MSELTPITFNKVQAKRHLEMPFSPPLRNAEIVRANFQWAQALPIAWTWTGETYSAGGVV